MAHSDFIAQLGTFHTLCYLYVVHIPKVCALHDHSVYLPSQLRVVKPGTVSSPEVSSAPVTGCGAPICTLYHHPHFAGSRSLLAFTYLVPLFWGPLFWGMYYSLSSVSISC